MTSELLTQRRGLMTGRPSEFSGTVRASMAINRVDVRVAEDLLDAIQPPEAGPDRIFTQKDPTMSQLFFASPSTSFDHRKFFVTKVLKFSQSVAVEVFIEHV